MGFSDMDKRKKITIGVASVGLLIGALLIVNSATGGELTEVVAPTEKPAVPEIDPVSKKKYVQDKEKMEDMVESGEVNVSGG
jgi:hypothetical protein